MKVCIGGTFNILHKGHKKLINKAFQIAGKKVSVFIGLTTGKILNKKSYVKTFEERKIILMQYLHEKGFIKRGIIKSIRDRYGPSIEKEFDVIVVSPETIKTAEEINKKAKIQGLSKILCLLYTKRVS